MSLSSSYVTSTTNSFNDDIFGYVILTDDTVAINCIVTSTPPQNLVVPSTVKNAGTTYTVTQLNSYAFLTNSPIILTISIPNTINAMFNQTFLSSPSLFNPAGPTGGPYGDNFSILTSITLTGGSSSFLYTDEYGILYVSSSNNSVFDTLFAAPPAFNSAGYTIPSNVTTIGPYAFVNSKLTSIVIPTNVTAIGTYAFFLVYLESLTIEGVITNFGYMPFYSTLPSGPATITSLIFKGSSDNASYGVTTADMFGFSMYTTATIQVTNTNYGNAITNYFETNSKYTNFGYTFTINYIPESTSVVVGSTASSGQTELQTALTKFSFVNPYATVKYDHRSGNVSVVANESELKELGNSLKKLSMPHKISGLSVSYTNTGRMYSQRLDHIVNKINSENIGRTKRGQSAIYFDNVSGDTDEYTGNLAALAGDDSSSYGCPKMYNMTMIDSGSSVW